MAWNGAGTYVLNPLYTPEVNGTVIDATRYNGNTSDIAGGISNCIAKDGQNVPTANLPMGGMKHTGVADANGVGQYLVYGQAAGSFSSLSITTTFASNGTTTIGDAAGDAFTINSSAVSTPNGLNFDSNTLVIDAAGDRVGVGRSPTQKLDVAIAGTGMILVENTASTADARVRVKNTQALLEMGQDGTGGYFQQTGAFPLLTYVNGLERMRIDASGNVTPGANNTQTLGATAMRWSTVFATALSDGADQLVGSSGTTARFGAGASWTAASIFTGGTTRLTVGSTGLVTIATPSSGSALFVNSLSGQIGIRSTVSGGASLDIVGDASSSYVGTPAAHTLHLFTNGTSRTVLDTVGNLYPFTNGAYASGLSANRWANVFSVLGDFSGQISNSSAGVGYAHSAASSGVALQHNVTNTSNTANSGVRQVLQTAGATAGDAWTVYSTTATDWAVGTDNSDGDAYVIAASGALGTSNVLRITPAGAVSISLGDFAVSRSSNGGSVINELTNTSNTASSTALHFVHVAGSLAGDAFSLYQVDGVTAWALGTDNSDSDAFVIAASGALGTSNVLRASTAGDITLPGTLTVTGNVNFNGTIQTFGDAAGDTLSFVGTPNGQIQSTTYTPTLTNITNIAASSVNSAYYLRIGVFVIVYFQIAVDPTAGSAATELGISLPVASNLGATGDLTGTATRTITGSQLISGWVFGDTANDRAQLSFFCDATVTSQVWYGSFMYRII